MYEFEYEFVTQASLLLGGVSPLFYHLSVIWCGYRMKAALSIQGKSHRLEDDGRPYEKAVVQA
jgi:hypothetical protein